MNIKLLLQSLSKDELQELCSEALKHYPINSRLYYPSDLLNSKYRIPARTCHVLRLKENKYKSLDKFEREDFLKHRNIGLNAWAEFERFRDKFLCTPS